MREADDGAGRTSSASDTPAQDIHQNPWIGLVYLFFVFLPLLFRDSVPALAVWISVAAVVVFLPLHFRAVRVGARARVCLALAMALLAYVVVPFNAGGHTFLLYAVATLAWCLPWRASVLVGVALFVPMLAQMLWFYPTLPLALGTAALSAVLGSMIVASIHFERARLRRDAQLRLSQDEVRRLARLAERERISRDLHDLLGHTLSLVALKSELAGRLMDRDPEQARRHITEVERVARQALAEVREAVSGMRAPELHAELAAAKLCLDSVGIELVAGIEDVPLVPEHEKALAMALREGVTNVIRHAGASRVEVRLQRRSGETVLEISDDGCGGVDADGNGLAGMRERLAACGGRLELGSPRGGGTRLSLRLPGEGPRHPPRQGVAA